MYTFDDDDDDNGDEENDSDDSNSDTVDFEFQSCTSLCAEISKILRKKVEATKNNEKYII